MEAFARFKTHRVRTDVLSSAFARPSRKQPKLIAPQDSPSRQQQHSQLQFKMATEHAMEGGDVNTKCGLHPWYHASD
jgi:hypothetical protein